MSNREQLNLYLSRIEQRLRAGAWSSGIALTTVVLAGATILLVLLINRFAFSSPSVTGARLLLFLALAATAVLALVRPLRRLNRRFAARRVEGKCPDFQQRLLTFVERNGEVSTDPFLELLAADTMKVTPKAEPSLLVPSARFAFAAVASLTGIGVFLWLLTAAPGFLGHGAALLWGAGSRTGDRPFYDIEVQPGDATVRKGGDQVIQAGLHGFQSSNAKLFARFQSSSKWDEAAMSRHENEAGFQFLFTGLAEPVEYYVEAGGIKSRHFKLNVLELPAVKRVRVTYHYPAWTGLKDAVQEQSGDLTAVQGTEAEVAIEFDRPLKDGVLALDSNALQFQRGQGNWVTARVPIQKDGAYHAEAIEAGKNIRISEDFFISAGPVNPPAVTVKRPGRDARVSPIEEVTVEVQAAGDFALQTMDLHYSVNGGPEKTVSLLDQKGQKQASGSTLITLEDFHLVPGDVVSLYASARHARNTARTDMYFVEAQPYEREYTQSQQMGGGGGGGQGQQQDQISQRQKEIISATWNQSRNTNADRAAAAANAKFLSDVQAKLRDQAKSLAERMRSRELASQNEEFSSFSKDMDSAAEAMGQAVGKLKTQTWKDALPHEQKALQHLLRAEATFREIQVAFGNQGGGGGGGGGGGRDLESLFDLELDTEKNQYETGQQANSADQRQKEIDEALQKLEQLARRQQELAAQQAQQRAQTFQQRWQQELLRREAEQLQRQMQQLASGQQQGPQQSGQQGQQQGQQGQSGQQGGQQQGGQQSGGQQSSSQSASGRSAAQQRLDQLSGRGQAGQQSANDQRIREAMQRLEQATYAMRRAGENGQNGSDARSAADRLQEARDLVNGLRKQEAAGELGGLTERASQLAGQQRSFEERLKKQAAAATGQESGPGTNREQGQQMAAEKEKMLADLQRLEKDMQNAARTMAGTERSAASKVREALGNMQQEELALRMKAAMEFLRRGYGSLQAPREAPVTAGLDRLRDQLNAAQNALGQNPGQGQGQSGEQASLERGLAQVERLRGEWREGQAQNGQGRDGQARDGQARDGQAGDGRGGDGQWRDGGGGGWDRTGAVRALNDIWRGGYQDHESRRAIQDVINEVASRPTQTGAALERLEALLRRKLEEKQSGQARAGARDRVPEGYSEAVADYFRRLTKNK